MSFMVRVGAAGGRAAYYGIFTRAQAKRRIRRLKKAIRAAKRENRRTMSQIGRSRSWYSMATTPAHKVARNQHKIQAAYRDIKRIEKRWSLGRYRKRGRRFLFWRRKR